jgi:hypothetical protein
VHVSSKNFPGLYPRTPVLKEREGKAKRRVGLGGMEGRKRKGKGDQGEGEEGRGEREGTEDSEGCRVPLN